MQSLRFARERTCGGHRRRTPRRDRCCSGSPARPFPGDRKISFHRRPSIYSGGTHDESKSQVSEFFPCVAQGDAEKFGFVGLLLWNCCTPTLIHDDVWIMPTRGARRPSGEFAWGNHRKRFCRRRALHDVVSDGAEELNFRFLMSH